MKNFGFGLLAGSILGVIIGYVKNPNTGNTIKHDLKIQIDETIADSENISDAKKRLDQSLDYLKNDGAKQLQNFSDFMTDRLDGFEMQIKPNLDKIDDQLINFEEDLEDFSENL